ncbi:MAG TPA: NDP-sugar synthase [Armatimonadota bacterium]
MLKGMMLAAGRGTRLGPLTESLPKPLLPVANRPVMAHGLCCLRRLGIVDVCVNVSYRAPQIIEVFGDGHAYDLHLHWSVEPAPLGTAGGMKRKQSLLDDDLVIVIAGDAMLDMDLAPLLAAHRAAGAFASLATVAVADPSCYGVVVSDAHGRIIRFQEKPAPGTAISHDANTGIYIFDPAIFDLIPSGVFYDFSLHVFPEILRRGLPFFAFPIEGYWTDIGNPGEYLRANLDYLAGRMRMEGDDEVIDGCLVSPSAWVDDAALSHCAIGRQVTLPRGCALTNCVAWPQTVVREPLHLSSAILTPAGNYSIKGDVALLLATLPASA